MIVLLLLAAAAADPTVPVPASPFQAAPLDQTSLGKATAREDLSQIAAAQQTSQVANNSINGPSTTGTVSIDGNAFQNVQGLTIVNANSGNNVSINAALNVNIRFDPAQ